MRLTRELARRFEDHFAEHFETLMRCSLSIGSNPENYAFYRDGTLRATCSTNPHASWTRCAYHVNQQPAESVRRVVDFFHQYSMPAKLRIIPDGFTPQQADVLTALGLRHIGFHTILWAPLPILNADERTDESGEPTIVAADLAEIEIREATTQTDIDAHIDIQLAAYGVPRPEIESLRPLRRLWWNLPHLRFYLACVDGVPAAQAILDCRDDVAYLASGSTMPGFRKRGLHTALILRRLRDAEAAGCRVVFGATDFENVSRLNQMACGLQVAYTAAWWVEPMGKL
ncbi:MAG: GNAT family N-acetyltransferase [Candidatus Methylacidiphilales bacterium]|nr:GNAT family N-acetyltransferase [Candidatus Methylacidiphilales bacterium]